MGRADSKGLGNGTNGEEQRVGRHAERKGVLSDGCHCRPAAIVSWIETVVVQAWKDGCAANGRDEKNDEREAHRLYQI